MWGTQRDWSAESVDKTTNILNFLVKRRVNILHQIRFIFKCKHMAAEALLALTTFDLTL